MRVNFFVFGLLLTMMPVSAWAEACALDISPINTSMPAVGVQKFWQNLATVTFTVTCPAGQTWSLQPEGLPARASFNVFDGASAVLFTFCRTGYVEGTNCGSQFLNGSPVLATGTGTGAPQQAVQLAVSGNAPYASFYGEDIKRVGLYGPGNSPAWFKLTSGGASVYGGVTATATIVQACEIRSLQNVTLNYTGSAAAANSFSFQHVCGDVNTPPVTISVGAGNNPNGEVRRAAKGAGRLGYRLYWDSGYTQEIGVAANNSTTAVGAGSKYIYAKVLRDDPGNHVPSGNGAYIDIVPINITY